MELLTEGLKMDAAIEYQALDTPAPGITSRYFKLDRWCKAVFNIVVDTLATAEQVVCEVWEALVNTGVGGAAIGGVAPTATCTIDANTRATVVTITCGVVLVGDTITINGVVFTAAAAPDHANQVFDQSGAPAAIATDLAACMADPASQALLLAGTRGIAIVVVDDGAAELTLTIADAGEATLTIVASDDLVLTCATVQALAQIEVEDTALSAADSWVAINLVGPVTANAAVVLVRGDSRYKPNYQAVAASDTDS